MATSRAFRLSTYLTLAVACVALGHALVPIFPEVGLFTAVSVVSLVIIYRLEVRVRLLSIPDANMLGGGIALSVALWAAYRIVRELRTGEFADLGWTLFIVALMAPLLMAAMPAKLLRREKHAGDYWQLHAAALGAIVLAAAVDETPFTFIAMAVYAGCAVWNLIEFHLARTSGAIPPIPAARGDRAKTGRQATPVPVQVIAAARRVPNFVRGLALTAAAAAIAVPLYLIMPRSSFGKSEFGRPRIEIGYAADQMIDLNRAGKLETNREVAFVVEARQNGQPKTDLDPQQRWRGKVLAQYRSGKWQPDAPAFVAVSKDNVLHSRSWSPPDLGPEQFELNFTVPRELGTEFLADPVRWTNHGRVPIAEITPDGRLAPWMVVGATILSPQLGPNPEGAVARYIQYYHPTPEPNLGPPLLGVTTIGDDLRDDPVPAVGKYGDRMLERLVEMKKLPPEVLDRDPGTLKVRPEHHEAVARAFEGYLSHDAGLTYTTNLRREDREVDPIEDFLLNSRSGHCERFASALVLLLRSQGIPTATVLGFKGCEHTGGGRYEIRHENAHVWAEALITRPHGNGGQVWHWLSLDPSPDGETRDDAAGRTGGLFNRARTALDRYLIQYTPEERKKALAATGAFLTSPGFLWALGLAAGAGLAIVAVRRLRWQRQQPEAAKEAVWLDRLLGVLAAGGFLPAPGQTPREFAVTVADELERRPQTVPVAAVPAEWVEVYYRNRFGGMAPSEIVQAQLDLRLEELRGALTGS